MARIVIIGAGLTGLSAAYHLEKKGFTDFLIVEKENAPGGLCRSIKQDGFMFDYTGHLLHSSDPYFSKFLEDIFDDEPLCSIQRNSYVYSHDTYTPYPYQINLHGLPHETIVSCIEGYLNRNKSIRQPKSFSDWVLKFFGPGFGKSFFFPYQSKLLQYDPKKLAASWTGRFVPQTSLSQMIYGALDHRKGEVGYNASFLYPHRGIQRLIDRLLRVIKSPIVVKKSVIEIDLRNKIILFNDGDSQPFDMIINTMPLDRLLYSLRDKATTRFKNAAKHLVCTGVSCLNVGLFREIGEDKHWIYYPEGQYPFYRLGFYHNFSKGLVPSLAGSLYVEASYRNKTEQSIDRMMKSCLKHLKILFNLNEGEIITQNHIKIPHAYVVYDFWREKNLKRLLKDLERHDIYSIGRYGAWKYSSMQESVLDGKKAAEAIVIHPARHDIESCRIKEEIKGHREGLEKEREL